MVYGGRLFAHHGLVHDTRNGLVVGSWGGASAGTPTWSGSLGVAHGYAKLRGFGPTYEATRWVFGIDEYTDLSMPLIAGPYAYTTTAEWAPFQLMALRLGDGARVWCQWITEQPAGTESGSAPYPVAAGHGLLFVSNGYGLAAYESGGRASDCSTPPAPSRSAPPQPALELTAARSRLLVGQRTRVVARLSGLPTVSGRRVAIHVDTWPFDGKLRRVARGTTASDGTFTFRYAPRRNARLRAQLVGAPRLVSQPATLYASFPMTVRKRGAGGSRPRLRVRLHASRGARVLRRPVYGYLARATKPWQRVARGRWRLGKRSATVTLRYPRGRLRRGDRWLVCTREKKPDAFGRARAIDPLCGRRALPR